MELPTAADDEEGEGEDGEVFQKRCRHGGDLVNYAPKRHSWRTPPASGYIAPREMIERMDARGVV